MELTPDLMLYVLAIWIPRRDIEPPPIPPVDN